MRTDVDTISRSGNVDGGWDLFQRGVILIVKEMFKQCKRAKQTDTEITGNLVEYNQKEEDHPR